MTAQRRTGLPWQVQLTIDVALSPVVFFALQGNFGLSTGQALLISTLVGAAWTGFVLITTRKVNAVALCVIAGMVVGAALTGVTGDPRFGVAKDSPTPGCSAWPCWRACCCRAH
ncbi:hypothetical protein KALB_1905 [Kutzneria albida DSM 43870]|uniref:Uncharacterized protein n=1 Tax=Kutzneria albida DSM 43870 TaxID=1449976 RepID=W5W3B6_9PSEU|nr:VC0807 family protein [Kutzneria albida]AHH95275.1 hypothetical protein KALB_1905 [Kutzneria albida DSM 43870]